MKPFLSRSDSYEVVKVFCLMLESGNFCGAKYMGKHFNLTRIFTLIPKLGV